MTREGIKRNGFILIAVVLVMIIILQAWLLHKENLAKLTNLSNALIISYTTKATTIECSSELRNSLLERNVSEDATFPDEFVKCLFSNTSESGISQLMSSKLFDGIYCFKTQASFYPSNRGHTALASFPGAGNSWTRELIENFSGILTGSVYGDGHMKTAFNGEQYTENVIVIKTHEMFGKINIKYDKVILLIRDPFDSILALYNLEHTHSHTDYVKEDKFNITKFRDIVGIHATSWRNFHKSWLQGYQGPIIYISYHRLRFSFYKEILRLAHFLKVPLSYKKLWCTHKNRDGTFHRQKPAWMIRSKLLNQALNDKLNEAILDVKQELSLRFHEESIEF